MILIQVLVAKMLKLNQILLLAEKVEVEILKHQKILI